MKRSFILELNAGATLDEIHKALALSSENNLISIVDGHAQTKDYVIEKECTISIFPPMSTR